MDCSLILPIRFSHSHEPDGERTLGFVKPCLIGIDIETVVTHLQLMQNMEKPASSQRLASYLRIIIPLTINNTESINDT